MNSEEIFNKVSQLCSKTVTHRYSTSFSLGIRLMKKKFRNPIYAVYGFVRLADEIVDTFHKHNKEKLLKRLKQDVDQALEDKISLNPILHNFQQVAQIYNINNELIDKFISSMEMDLHKTQYSQKGYEEYIYGSAEAVGLMCLKIFCDGDKNLYNELKDTARKLGSAYQKVNFLRDLNHDYKELGRIYFPDIDINRFNHGVKRTIILDIQNDFNTGYKGIKKLPGSAKLGVYLSFVYYTELLKKISRTSPEKLLQKRIRLSNAYKYVLFIYAIIKCKLSLV
jgi:phytoene/squalene synthetase